MSNETEQFEIEARTLEASHALAVAAVELCGRDAGAALMGAALRAWAMELGEVRSIELAREALDAIVRLGTDAPTTN